MMHSLVSLKAGKFAAGILAACLISTAAEALPRKLLPVDQCARDPSFVKFRSVLRDVVKREDGQALLAMYAPGLKPSGYKPPERGRKVEAEDVMEREEWEIVHGIMRMGCAVAGPVYVMPSASVQLDRYPEKDLKDKVLVLGGAKLFKVPHEEKSVVAILNWNTATAVGTGGDFWTGIRLADGREGWVSDSDIYWMDPSFRYEVTFEKRHGKWMITGIIGAE